MEEETRIEAARRDPLCQIQLGFETAAQLPLHRTLNLLKKQLGLLVWV